MSVLGMNSEGVVRTAFEFKDIFDKSGESKAPYYCPFCSVSYVDRNIVKDGVKAPHFALPQGKLHRNGCNGEATPGPVEADMTEREEPIKKMVGDVEFPEELVDARRRRATFRPPAEDRPVPRDETEERRRSVDTKKLIASRYTSSLLRTFVKASKGLKKLAGTVAKTKGKVGSNEYKEAFGQELRARALTLFGDRLNYQSAFASSNIAPPASPRIYQGVGKVVVDENMVVIIDEAKWQAAYKAPKRCTFVVGIDCMLLPDAPRLHVQTMADLRAAADASKTVEWSAYGSAVLVAADRFELAVRTVDYVHID